MNSTFRQNGVSTFHLLLIFSNFHVPVYFATCEARKIKIKLRFISESVQKACTIT